MCQLRDWHSTPRLPASSLLFYIRTWDTHLMSNTLSRNIYRALFSDDQWDLIYAMAGHALDNDDFTPEDVYSIRNKIHALFDYNDWYLQLHWWCCYLPWFGWCGFDGHHYCYCFSSILFFSYEEIKSRRDFILQSRRDVTVAQVAHTISTRPASSTRLDTYKRHRDSWTPQSLHQSRVRQRIALPTLWDLMHNVSSSNIHMIRSFSHLRMVRITSGWCLTKTQTGW